MPRVLEYRALRHIKWWRVALLMAFLLALFFGTRQGTGPSYQASWPVHFAFALALTLLLYGELLRGRWPWLYLAGLLALMALWETYESVFGSLLEHRMRVVVVDTTMDTISGLAGALLAMWIVRRVRARRSARAGDSVGRSG